MMSVLITTGKKPGKKSRAIARALFLMVPGSRLEFRGKRTLSALIKKAKRFHFSRLCTIYREEGKPSEIRFLSLEENLPGWLSPTLQITSVETAEKLPRKGQSQHVKITGAKARTLAKLLSLSVPPEGEETGSRLIASSNSLSLFLGNKKLAKIGVSYAR